MPKSRAGKEVMRNMKKEYGEKKGEEVFYASINKKKPGTEKWHKGKK